MHALADARATAPNPYWRRPCKHPQITQITQSSLSPCFQNTRQILTRRPMRLLDTGLVARDESVAVPLVVVAAQVPVEQVKQAVTKRGVAIDMIAGRASRNIDAIGAVADALVVVQVVVAG